MIPFYRAGDRNRSSKRGGRERSVEGSRTDGWKKEELTERGTHGWVDGREEGKTVRGLGGWMKQEEKASMGSSELQQPCGVVSSQAETSKPLGPHMDQ